MDDKELHDTIIELYIKYADLNVIAEKLGISVELVKKHVALARLPESLKDKIAETKIPLDRIGTAKHNASKHDRDKGIEELAVNIKAHGLLQPITVCQKSDTKEYVLLVGQRRLLAFVELNKKYPGEGWDKIPVNVVDCPD